MWLKKGFVMVSAMLMISLINVYLTVGASAIQWNATVGMEGRLNCDYRGENADIIIWRHNDSQIAYWSTSETAMDKRYRLSEPRGTLTINRVTREDAGSYTCVVYDTHHKTSTKVEGELQLKDEGLTARNSSHSSSAEKFSLTALLMGILLKVTLQL